MDIGNDIVAAAPGVIVDAQGEWPDVPANPNLGYLDDGNRITIDHGLISSFTTGNSSDWGNGVNFLTIYCHLDKVLVSVGQVVNRGDLIAKSGHTGNLAGPNPHVHFQAGGFSVTRVDPFRDIAGIADHISYWTKDNDPKIVDSDTEVYLP
jgi:murein DD-endopeptidase MepM/ murein hydrolase activator NlpD